MYGRTEDHPARAALDFSSRVLPRCAILYSREFKMRKIRKCLQERVRYIALMMTKNNVSTRYEKFYYVRQVNLRVLDYNTLISILSCI